MGNLLTSTAQLRFAPRENFADLDDLIGRSERKAPYTQRICADGQRRNVTGGMTVRSDDSGRFEAIDDHFCEVTCHTDVEDKMIAMIDKARLEDREAKGKMPNATPKEREAHERTIARKRRRRDQMRASETGVVVMRRGTAA